MNKMQIDGKALLSGAVLGGLVMFVWVMISWMVLPWHMTSLHGFSAEGPVSQAILANAPKSGIYILPAPETHASPGRKQPFVFASVSREGLDPSQMGRRMAVELLTNGVIAAIFTFLVLIIGKHNLDFGFWCKVRFIVTLGVLMAIASAIPAWNWWQFPLGYTIICALDTVIATFFGGLAIAKVTAPEA